MARKAQHTRIKFLFFLAALVFFLPENLVAGHFPQLNARRHDDLVARGELLRIEAGRPDGDRGHLSGEDRVDVGAGLRQDPVTAAADELGTHVLGQLRFQVEDSRAVDEHRDADRRDVGGEKGPAAG
jgi:hypothetical protein